MKKVCICGHFGGHTQCLDGQTVKTKNLYNRLIKDGYTVKKTDTFNPKKRLVLILLQCVIRAFTCRNIIILPAHNGIKIFVPLFVMLKKLTGVRIHYDVVGGWLPEYLSENKWLIKHMKQIDCVYVETHTMQKDLSDIGITNTEILPNFKDIKPVNKNDLVNYSAPPYKLCMFSRICEQKGITQAVKITDEINKECGQTVYTLDIYGRVDESYKESFDKLLSESSDAISYKGFTASEESINKLKGYFLLLFPTKSATEGHPGTILGAYNAGVPVLASEWNSCFDIVEKNKTGLTYEFNNFDKMKEILVNISRNPDIINEMRENCLKKAEEFKPETAIKNLTDKLGEGI